MGIEIDLKCVIFCSKCTSHTVDLVIFLRGGQIREFKNLAKIINIIALLKKRENS